MKRIATIGFFDGVHSGHRYLFDRLRTEADRRGLQALIITFDIHPRAVLQSDYVPQLLTTPEERQRLLSRFGEVRVLSFAQVQPLTAAQFMQQLHDQYEVSVLLMGYDHQFGSDRLHRPQDYRLLGQQFGIEVLHSNQFTEGEWHVSSTEIRTALLTGNIALANELLGRPYAISGTVVHGKAIGRTIGFPTANIQPANPHKIIPHPGVYEVMVIGDRLEVRGFCNIATNGTIEVHIPDFKGDLYDRPLTVQFLRFVREEKQFDSLEDLRDAIKADVDNILHLA